MPTKKKTVTPPIELPATITKRAQPGARMLRRPNPPKKTWPITLLIGADMVGKSHTAAVASSSPSVDATVWINWGEKDPSWLSEIPGADFSIVDHNETTADVIVAIRELKADQPANATWLLVIDSATEFWKSIRGEKTRIAIERDHREENGMLIVGRDLYHEGDADWAALINEIRTWHGPVILTARPDEGPTRLRYDADAIVELPEAGTAIIRGARTIHPLPIITPLIDFTMHEFWALIQGTTTQKVTA